MHGACEELSRDEEILTFTHCRLELNNGLEYRIPALLAMRQLDLAEIAEAPQLSAEGVLFPGVEFQQVREMASDRRLQAAQVVLKSLFEPDSVLWGQLNLGETVTNPGRKRFDFSARDLPKPLAVAFEQAGNRGRVVLLREPFQCGIAISQPAGGLQDPVRPQAILFGALGVHDGTCRPEHEAQATKRDSQVMDLLVTAGVTALAQKLTLSCEQFPVVPLPPTGKALCLHCPELGREAGIARVSPR